MLKLKIKDKIFPNSKSKLKNNKKSVTNKITSNLNLLLNLI